MNYFRWARPQEFVVTPILLESRDCRECPTTTTYRFANSAVESDLGGVRFRF